MFEAIRKLNGCTIWRGKDAEGRKCYAVTTDQHGMSVRPSGCNVLYSMKAAIEVAKEPSHAND